MRTKGGSGLVFVDTLPFLVATIFSAMLMYMLCKRNAAGMKLWASVSAKIRKPSPMTIWFIACVIVYLVCFGLGELFHLDTAIRRIITGFFLGLVLALMPDLYKPE